MNEASLPAPSAAAEAQSERLVRRIEAEIAAAGGWLGFERFMSLALYEPGLGYYSAGSEKIGPRGDFVTAPELGRALAVCLAARLKSLLKALERPVVLELGAGTGRLAADLLAAFDRRGLAALEYWILEPSADLRARQEQALAPFGARVRWLSSLPEERFDGLVLANEVVDALPVSRFLKRGGAVLGLGVAVEDGRFAWREAPADARLSRAVERVEASLGKPLPEAYRSELCLMLDAWLKALAAPLGRGALLFIDYGLVRHEYYHPQRADGTLICHYRQRAHSDVFFLPGLQDISAWVDFSALAAAGRAAGLEVAGFTTQAQFLLQSAAALEPAELGLDDPRAVSALKTLVLPGEMGERFKLLLLDKHGPSLTLPGRDFRSRL